MPSALRKTRVRFDEQGQASASDLHDIIDEVNGYLVKLTGDVTALQGQSRTRRQIQRIAASAGGGDGTSSAIKLHNSLPDLQGGNYPDQYFHFNELHHAQVGATLGVTGWESYLTALYGTTLGLQDTGGDDFLILTAGSNLSTDRTLTLTTDDADRTFSLLGNLYVESLSRINQDLTTDASPRFGGASIVAEGVNGPTVNIISYNAVASGAVSHLAFYRARGTELAPSTINFNDNTGALDYYGYDNAGAWGYAGGITIKAVPAAGSGNPWTAADHGSALIFLCNDRGSTTLYHSFWMEAKQVYMGDYGDGTAAAPSYSWYNERSLGLYRVGAATQGLTGNVNIGTAASSAGMLTQARLAGDLMHVINNAGNTASDISRIRLTTNAGEFSLRLLGNSDALRFYNGASDVAQLTNTGGLTVAALTVGSLGGYVIGAAGVFSGQTGIPYTDLTYSGLTAGHALVASSATAASFRALVQADVGGLTTASAPAFAGLSVSKAAAGAAATFYNSDTTNGSQGIRLGLSASFYYDIYRSNTTGYLNIVGNQTGYVGVALGDAHHISVGTTTGTKIGTATNQKIGFFNATPVVQQTKASHNNWAALSDVVSALVSLGLFDIA